MNTSPGSNDFPQEKPKRVLRVALIGSSEGHRQAITQALPSSLCQVSTPFTSSPQAADIPRIASLGYDAFMVDLDSDVDSALMMIEGLSEQRTGTVMAISTRASTDLVIRAARAGAREFLAFPLNQEEVTEALQRAANRRLAEKPASIGRLCVFMGAKGGTGTTTVATNFALAAARESQGRVLLIDLDLPLGDAVLNFGVQGQYSTVDPLSNFERLDFNLLSQYLVEHDSGVSILAAPGRLVPCSTSTDAVNKLIQTARLGFDCVVVDAGCRFDLANSMLFGAHAHMYLVLQTTIADLRNANRIVSGHFVSGVAQLDVVLNRCSSRSAYHFDDAQLEKALTKAPRWRIPNDYAAVCEMQTTAKPLALKKSPIADAFSAMVRAGLELPAAEEKQERQVRSPNGVLGFMFGRGRAAYEPSGAGD